MKALQLPKTDQERLQILNTMYVKGLSTPKDELAFSSEMLVYIKPFISKLQAVNSSDLTTLPNLSLVRQVVDELLQDILGEIQASCLRLGGNRGERLAAEYGLNFMFNPFEADFFYSKKVA